MKFTDFFTTPGMFYMYASENKEDNQPYGLPILGATLEEDDKGLKQVSVIFSRRTRKIYPLDKKDNVIPTGPSFIFKSEGNFFSVGPFEKSDVESVFGGLPMTVAMMEELFATSYRVLVDTPESADSAVKKIYIQKEDGSFYVKSGKNWEESLGEEGSLNLIEISPGVGASVAKAIINNVPLTASQVGITPRAAE